MRRKMGKVRGETKGNKQEVEKKVKVPQIFHKSYEDEHYVLKALMKYSRYSWSTWFVLKIFIKLTTYSMLKARDMEEEAHAWITDWGPIVNPFIDYIFFPVLRILTFLNQHMELFTEDVISDYLFPLYDFFEPFLTIVRDISVKLMLFNLAVYETLVCVDLGTLVFVILFLCACGDILCWHWQAQVMKIYKKVKREVDREFGQDKPCRINTEILPQLEHKTHCQKHCQCSDKDINDSKIIDGPQLADIIREELLKGKKMKQEHKLPKSIAITHVKLEDDAKENLKNIKGNKTSKPPTVFSCWMCAKPGKGMLKCSVCRKARYCGETCQWEDWGRHKKMCRVEGEKREEKEKRKKRRSTIIEEENEVD